MVDPDRWVQVVDGQRFARRIQHGGRLQFDQRYYYVAQRLAGQVVEVQINAQQRQLEISYSGHRLKQVPIKGLIGHEVPFGQFVEQLVTEARRHDKVRKYRQGRLW